METSWYFCYFLFFHGVQKKTNGNVRKCPEMSNDYDGWNDKACCVKTTSYAMFAIAKVSLIRYKRNYDCCPDIACYAENSKNIQQSCYLANGRLSSCVFYVILLLHAFTVRSYARLRS